MRRRYRGLSYGTPLALSDEMILAALDGQKTLTVRALSKQERAKFQKEVETWPCTWNDRKHEWSKLPGPYGEIGDYLWVRESYRIVEGRTEYRLDSDPEKKTANSEWLPVVGMPEDSSRMCLCLTGYRFMAGVQSLRTRDMYHDGYSSIHEGKQAKADIRKQFIKAWNTRYRDPEDKWEANPPVWVTEFRLLSPEESKALKKAKDFLK